MTIFLDIDGVMVHSASWIVLENLNDGFPDFNTKACIALNKLIKEDTIIVLTTSHRHRFTIDEWKNIFERRGIVVKNLKLLESNFSKKDAIVNWLNANTDSYMIIDDDTRLNDLPKELKEHLILTSPLIGLV